MPSPIRRLRQALLFVVLAASMCGDQIAAVALLFRLVDADRPGIAVAVLFGSLVVPRVLFGWPAGAIADRYDTRRVLIVLMAVQALIAIGIAIDTNAALSIVGAYALGVCGTIVNAAVFAALPTILGQERLLASNSYYELATSISTSIGPVLGGVFTVTLGGRGALLIDAASFAIVIPVLLLVGLERPPADLEASHPGALRGAGTGLRLLFGDPVLRRTFVAVITGVLATSSIDVALVYFIRRYLDAGGIGYGLILGLWGLGMVIGALAAGTLVRHENEHRWLLAGIFVIGAVVAIAGIAPNALVLASAYIIGGVANSLFNIAGRSLVHRRIDPAYYGRVGAARLALISAAVAIGFLLGGVFGPRASRTVYIVAGLVTMASTTVGVGLRVEEGEDGESASAAAVPTVP